MSDGDLRYIEDTTGGRLGRNVVWHDPQNRAYPTRGVLFAEDAPITTKSWWTRDVWDQNGHSSCTSESATGVIFTSPFRMVLDRANLDAYNDPSERYALYRYAQRFDPWQGEAYEGSSTDAPFKVLRERDQIREWRWNFGLDDTLRTLSKHGAVSIGTVWKEAMFKPDSNGYIRPEGDVAGGHAYRLLGVNAEHRYVIGVNSWGRSWGIGGRFRMTWDTLEQLLGEDGEAVTVVL